MSKFRIIVLSIISIAAIGVFFKKDDLQHMYDFSQFNKEYKDIMLVSNELLKEAKSLDIKDKAATEALLSKAKIYHEQGVIVGTMVYAKLSNGDICTLLDESLQNMKNEAIVETELLNPDGSTLKQIFTNRQCANKHEKWASLARKVYTSTNNPLHITRLKQTELEETTK